MFCSTITAAVITAYYMQCRTHNINRLGMVSAAAYLTYATHLPLHWPELHFHEFSHSNCLLLAHKVIYKAQTSSLDTPEGE